MRCRVSKDVEPVGAVDRHGLHRVLGGHNRREIPQRAVDPQGHDRAIGEEGETVGGIGHVRRDERLCHSELLGDVSLKATEPRGGIRPE